MLCIWPHNPLFLLHDMAQLMSQMPLLPRSDMHLCALGIGQRADLSGLIGVVVDPNIIKGQPASLFKVHLHLGGNAGQIGLLPPLFFLGLLNDCLSHAIFPPSFPEIHRPTERAKGQRLPLTCEATYAARAPLLATSDLRQILYFPMMT